MHDRKVKDTCAASWLDWRALGLLAIGFGCLSACTTAEAPRQEPQASQGSQESQGSDDELIAMGWIQAAGEVRIYPRKADLGKLYDGSCTSGAMTNRRTMPKSFNNHYVAVYGTFIDAQEIRDMTLQGASIGVENYCGSPRIAIISRIERVPEK
jgi:hypothetical protein